MLFLEVGVLFLLAPVVAPVLVVIAFCVLVIVIVIVVVQAFGEGFVTGSAMLAAAIGLPSLGLIGLSGAMHVLRPKPIPSSATARESADARSRLDGRSGW